MPTSAALAVKGRSGKMRIHSLPFFCIWRAIVLRAASIWLDRMLAVAAAFRPKAPKDMVMPRVATRFLSGFTRPVCHLRCLTFLGKRDMDDLIKARNPNIETRNKFEILNHKF